MFLICFQRNHPCRTASQVRDHLPKIHHSSSSQSAFKACFNLFLGVEDFSKVVGPILGLVQPLHSSGDFFTLTPIWTYVHWGDFQMCLDLRSKSNLTNSYWLRKDNTLKVNYVDSIAACFSFWSSFFSSLKEGVTYRHLSLFRENEFQLVFWAEGETVMATMAQPLLLTLQV